MNDLMYFVVEDDAMSGDRIYKGDIVVVKPKSEVALGEIALVFLKDNLVLRRIALRERKYILIASNPKHDRVEMDNIYVVGAVKKMVINY